MVTQKETKKGGIAELIMTPISWILMWIGGPVSMIWGLLTVFVGMDSTTTILVGLAEFISGAFLFPITFNRLKTVWHLDSIPFIKDLLNGSFGNLNNGALAMAIIFAAISKAILGQMDSLIVLVLILILLVVFKGNSKK